jgi:methylmalonyl-CoA mutase C-terminal domain/subunit
MTIFKKVIQLMKTKGLDDVLLFGGGIIPKEDIDRLKKLGVGELFTPGTSTYETVDYVKNWVGGHRQEAV